MTSDNLCWTLDYMKPKGSVPLINGSTPEWFANLVFCGTDPFTIQTQFQPPDEQVA